MLLKIKKLQKNQKVALIAPSSRISEDKLEKAIENIKKLDLIPELLYKKEENQGYFSASDQQRLNYLIEAFENNKYSAIFCIRGGYGATRLLNKINYKIIKNNPKIFVGFSDITALQAAFYKTIKLPSLHGVVASSIFTNYTVNLLKKYLFENTKNFKLELPNAKELTKGQTEGIIIGGNLTLLTNLIGTPFQYNFKDKIVFIEDIAEPPYKIDRMLTHLINTTNIKKAKAIVFGTFNKCQNSDFNINEDESFSIEEIIKNNFAELKIPVLYNVQFGHIENSLIVPIGKKAFLDSEKKHLILLDNFAE